MDIDVRLLAPTATIFGTSVASYLWYLNRQRKHVSVCVLRAGPLIALKGDARKRLKVSFGGRPIESTHLLHLSLLNDGNTPVTMTDYQSPFRIELNPDANILEVDVIETWPADLDRRIPAANTSRSLIKGLDKNAVELTPVLLNPQDEIVVQLLVENYNNHINVTQHVNGINRVNLWTESRALARGLSFLGAAILIFAAFFVEPDAPYELIMPSVPYCLILLFGVALYAAGVLWPHSHRQRGAAAPAVNNTRRVNAMDTATPSPEIV